MNKLFSRKIFFLLLIVLFFCVVINRATAQEGSVSLTSTSALSFNTGINSNDIEVVIKPEFPSAYEKVTVRLDSNTVDLNRYQIEWVIDGQIEKSGLGLRDFETTSGAYGTIKKIDVLINLNSSLVKKIITIAPQDVTVLWEAIDSYVPPFYRGKKLPGSESVIKISAIPNFKMANNSLNLADAVYLWTRNDSRILNVGGYGKDSITIEQNKFRSSEKITANVSSLNNGIRAEKSITIPTVDPEIHWYYKNENNYRKLLSIDRGLRITSGNVVLVGEPYFFSTSNYLDDLNYTWKVNNETLYLEPGSIKKELLVQNPGQTGQASFNLSMENPKTFLQSAAASVSLYFQNN